MKKFVLVVSLFIAQTLAPQALAAPYDTILGDAGTLGEPNAHWFAVIAYGADIAYLVDGDAGKVRGSMTLSMFSPAIEPALKSDRIYSYGSYYTRTYYGDRTDLVLVYNLDSTIPIKEVEIPPKSAGLGHGGMIGLIEDRYIGVWNITPGMSVSLVDTATDTFLSEISTPGCAGVYPVENGFLMACADGKIQYIVLDADGEEVDRRRSESFFAIDGDPVFDYAVPSDTGWLFLSLDGEVYDATVQNGTVKVSQPWSINPPDVEGATDANRVPIEPDDSWRIGGNQAFAYNAANRLLVTIMHEGGGQETFDDAGTQLWAFSMDTGRRGYVVEMEEGVLAEAVELTNDSKPLLLVTTNEGELRIYDALSSQLIHTMSEMGGPWGSMIQRLMN